MTLTVSGDLVVDRSYNISNISSEVIGLFNQSDVNIVNLEAPVTNCNSKILKTGPHLKADKGSTLHILKALNIDIVTLANNHVLDYGERGMKETLDFCRENGIQTVGAGENLKEASKTLMIETEQGKVAIVNFAENEWASATNTTAGANPMDIISNTKQIQEAKKNADFVLVIIHGGNEYNHYPSPRMAKQYRFYAENGADMLIGHHTHCISGYEIHQGVPIFYSLGNFLFTTAKEKLDSWYSGLVLKLSIQKGKQTEFEVIPVAQTKENHVLSVKPVNEKLAVFEMIDEINKTISNDDLLQDKWKKFVRKVNGSFIRNVSPVGGIKNRYIRGALCRLNLHRLFLHEMYLKEHLNRIRCEAHYDVTMEVLKEHLIMSQKK